MSAFPLRKPTDLVFRSTPRHSPDGLTESSINRLLREVYEELDHAPPPAPTTALLDDSAAERRERRIMQRRLGATVRVLRVHRTAPVPAGTEAA
ncbi:hypothetical protein [Allokutzneria oryzae]|uniref:Uncharacterized protein n=1 Tax=Allokutzneria oryzae TaxID=1378989 RepID=A0ABV5ZZF5_9PSEU